MHKEFFKLLQEDHNEVKDILEKLKKAGDGSQKQRDELFLKLRQEIKPHMKAEEDVFYSAIKKNKETQEDALEAMEEHHVTEMVLGELEKMPKDEERWKAKLSVFKELVEHHIKEEESKVFKDADKVISVEEMKTIQKRFQEEKEKIRQKIAM